MGSLKPEVPYGRRLIPPLIDNIARDNPNKVFASIPKSFDLTEGYIDVTYDAFSRAINRAAAFLEDRFGKSTSFETLAYLGPLDIRYFVLICAVCKVGYKLLLPSPRNSLEGQLNLFKSTDCNVILSSEGYHISPEFISHIGLSPIPIPSVASLLAEGHAPYYSFTKSYDEAKHDPFVVLHTSGSTGLPKPIVLKHGWTSAMDAYNLLPHIDGYEPLWWKLRNRKAFVALPPFHSAGIIVGFMAPLWYDLIMVWGPSNRPLSAVLVDEVLDTSGADMIYIAPSILEDMVQSHASLKRLEKLAVVGYGGAPLGTEVGNILCQKSLLMNTTGSTEMGPLPFWDKAPEDWEYFHFTPEHKGIEFRPAGDGAYEQIFVRHESSDQFHSAWWTFPDLEEYSMNDLYTPHPTKPNLWLYAGRADDVIVLSNGEKLNPTSMEVTLRQHPAVKGALVVGQSRFVPAAIIELKEEVAGSLTDPEKKARYLEEDVWQYAMKANEAAPAHAQLSLDRIILSDPEKPFARAGKGTMQRGATVKFYAKEIDEIYKRVDEGEDIVALPKIDINQDLKSLETSVGALVESVVKIQNLKPEQDFFAMGMDSLHVMTLVRLLKLTLVGLPHDEINTRLIYSNSSLVALALSLKRLRLAQSNTNVVDGITREQRMQDILDDFVVKLPKPTGTTKNNISPTSNHELVVLLTGSTGSLGSYLLHTLITSTKISKIYCLNRTDDAEERQAKENAEKGLISKWDQRLEFLQADLSKPNFGVDENVFTKLKNEVSVLIHNQWTVDFNLDLSSFTPHIEGVLSLISLSFQSHLSPPIFFTSSIGTLVNWNEINPDHTLVPETALKDPRIPLHQGYSESKWISENLLGAARTRSEVSSAILRVGQIAGPVERGTKGIWNQKEWLPSLIASSKYLGALPNELPGHESVQWVPVDLLAEIVGELVLVNCAGESGKREAGAWTEYYHLFNTNEGKWQDLVPAIKVYFGKYGQQVDIVSFDQWLTRLEHSAKNKEVDVGINPAVKLFDFYQAMKSGGSGVKMDTKETQAKSEKMRELTSVHMEWMRIWLEQWEF